MCYVIGDVCYAIVMLCYNFNMNNLSDSQLIDNYLAGDEKSLEFLVGRYLKSIYNLSRRLTGDENSADDITQDVFIKVWKNIKKYDNSKSFKAWIFRIAKNTAIDFLRKKKNLLFYDLEKEENDESAINNIPDPASLPDEIFDRQNLKEELDKAIDKLPLKYQIVVMLHNLDDCTFQEISDTLSEPLNTIKSRYLRALTKLRNILIEE